MANLIEYWSESTSGRTDHLSFAHHHLVDFDFALGFLTFFIADFYHIRLTRITLDPTALFSVHLNVAMIFEGILIAAVSEECLIYFLVLVRLD